MHQHNNREIQINIYHTQTSQNTTNQRIKQTKQNTLENTDRTTAK